MKPLKVLNLYAGIGGNRKLWQNVEVTAVELEPGIAGVYKDLYPNDEMVIGDAHKFLIENYKEYEFIWSSPPCPTHSDIRRCGVHKGQYAALYPDMTLYQEIILLQHFAKGDWVVENVRPYYKPLIPPSVELHRHYFWTNFLVRPYKVIDDRIHCDINGSSEIYGFDLKNYAIKDKRKILRNLVNPEVAAHLLNSARHDFPPMPMGTLFENENEQKYA